MGAHKNILLIVADDLGKYVGGYGCKSVTTPTLDQFIAEGVKFDMAYASTASCSGSRSTIYTGLHTHENGQYGLNSIATHFQTFEFVDTVPTLFNKAGYLTGIVGKVHVGVKTTYPWTVYDDIETRDAAKFGDHCDVFFKRAKDEDKPFNLVVGFHDVHRDMSRGGFANNSGPFDPRVRPYKISPDVVEVPDWLCDGPVLRKELAEYYECINRFDQGVKFILENLERRGMRDDTLVIITSDNGPPFINAKLTLFESGTCLPFMVQDPRLKANGIKGTSNPNMISFLDILPTMLDFAGLPLDLQTRELSPPRRGRSILSILDKTTVLPESEWPHHIFGSHTYHQRDNYWPTRVIRTRKYKYHRNVAWQLNFPWSSDLYASLSFEEMRNLEGGGRIMLGKRPLEDYIRRPPEQLFDMEKDPLEVENLVDDPQYADILNDLRNRLEAWQEQTEDLWLFKDGVSITDLKVHLGDDSMVMPDRFDFDPNRQNLRSGDIKTMKLTGNLKGIRGGTLYASKKAGLDKAAQA